MSWFLAEPPGDFEAHVTINFYSGESIYSLVEQVLRCWGSIKDWLLENAKTFIVFTAIDRLTNVMTVLLRLSKGDRDVSTPYVALVLTVWFHTSAKGPFFISLSSFGMRAIVIVMPFV